DETRIAARERRQHDPPGRKHCAGEVRLEAEDVLGARREARRLRGKEAGLPGAVRGDDGLRLDLRVFAAAPGGAAYEALPRAGRRTGDGLLQDLAARARGFVEEERVERGPIERARIGPGSAQGRHRRFVRLLAGPERDGAHFGSRRGGEPLAEAEAGEKRKPGGGDELAADLAPGKARLLQHDHAASSAREEKRRAGPGRPAADDER